MSKRFGRNQRRALRAQIEQQSATIASLEKTVISLRADVASVQQVAKTAYKVAYADLLRIQPWLESAHKRAMEAIVPHIKDEFKEIEKAIAEKMLSARSAARKSAQNEPFIIIEHIFEPKAFKYAQMIPLLPEGE